MSFILNITKYGIFIIWIYISAFTLGFNKRGGLLTFDYVSGTLLFIFFFLVLRSKY